MTGGNRAATALWTIAVFFAVLAAAGIAGLDGLVTRYTAGQPDGGTIWADGMRLLDLATFRWLGTYLLGAVLLIAAGLLLVLSATRPTGFLLLYVAMVQFTSTAIAELSRPWFGRVRPYEAVQGGDLWLAGPDSFPSVHAAFYGGLFFPLILLFPRLGPIWAAPPLFVAAARVMEHDHYLSDVSASLAVAAALAAGLCFIAEKGRA